ncbi:class I SAM-dependent methyltransferase [Rossellomorea marisflavi]|uniref:S-adenosyl-L-methionine-dependent methyltransferase n=1 Tax=Rossellomorea marisflavi TaxID=189381 RepID=A0A5D4RYC0_9BACI|nr:class I SAM-dependent methyltransferase [Rossellomorea marisflavi]TYS54838.1 class I SAM-dependent methyltransferase [Rossellomorea marisflavi]
MNQNENSITSLVSAFSRAYHSLYDSPKIFNDFLARDLISDDEFDMISKNMIQGISFFNSKIGQEFQEQPDKILKWISQIQLSPTPLARAAFCEKVLLNEIKLGTNQYVILGAGLDTFSFRHPELDNTLEIFEVDHPASQSFKKKRLADKNMIIPNNLHFIPMDFSKRLTDQDFILAGFDYSKKTFFSLLGVSYYLSKREISNLLSHLFSKVPSGSSIVFDYGDEGLFKSKGTSNRVENMIKMAAVGGEKIQSCFTTDDIEIMLEKSNLLIYEHLTPSMINDRFFSNRSDYLTAFETINYIHAVKR